jgi:hypothetical protein
MKVGRMKIPSMQLTSSKARDSLLCATAISMSITLSKQPKNEKTMRKNVQIVKRWSEK